jgi:hypothetical protein
MSELEIIDDGRKEQTKGIEPREDGKVTGCG